jgi:hypothetical protein
LDWRKCTSFVEVDGEDAECQIEKNKILFIIKTMRVSSKASAAGFLLLLVGTQVQTVQAESYLDTTLQEMVGLNIHGRALQAEQGD